MTQQPHPAPLLTVRRLGVDFVSDAGRRTAVGDVSLTVSRGQVLALVGESGSGKSVTAMSLLGLLPRNARVEGSATLRTPDDDRGIELVGATPGVLRSVRGRRIAAVFQEPFTAFNPVLRLGAQVIEAIRAHEHVSPSRAAARTLELFERVGLREPRRIFRSFPHQISGGQLQRAMIAMAISGTPELLIADEPTTALDVTVQAGILDLLRELRDELNTAILLITHDMGVVADVADDVVVLRDGSVQETGSVARVFASPESPYTRQLLAAVPRVDVAPETAGHPAPVEPAEAPETVVPAAELTEVAITYGSRRHLFTAVHDVSLSVPVGRTVGLVGESGSGKTTLGKAMAGLVPPSAGTIEVAGRPISGLSARELRAARADIGFVFQNPAESLNPRTRVGDVVAEPLRVHTDLDRAARAERAADLLRRVDLPSDAARRYPHELSGGQRQRVAIARALVLHPRLVIADEPTSALDVSVQATILDLLTELQREFGFGCLFISHDLAVVRQVSEHVVVLRDGRVVEAGPTEAVLSRPADDYTRALLASVPVPDPALQRAKRAAPGRA